MFFYFDPNTKAPISLMELGLVSQLEKTKVIVCCPNGFYRKGNVEVMCDRFGLRLYSDLVTAMDALYDNYVDWFYLRKYHD